MKGGDYTMSSRSDKIISSILNSYDFEKVSDLSKEQFFEILSKIINESLADTTLTRRSSGTDHHHRHRH